MGESGELKCPVTSCDRGSTNSLKYTSHIIISFLFKITLQIKTPILIEILAVSPLKLKFLPPFKVPTIKPNTSQSLKSCPVTNYFIIKQILILNLFPNRPTSTANY